MTDASLIVFGAAVIALAVPLVLLVLAYRSATADQHEALIAEANATRSQDTAETERDAAVVARKTAEAERDQALTQLQATQTALAATSKELTDARVHSDPAGALAGVLHETIVPASGATGLDPAGGHGGTASAVPAAGAAEHAGDRPASGGGR